MCSRAAALALFFITGCGEKTPTVGVGEAPPVGFPAPSTRFADGDTTYADTTYADTLSAAADTLRADTSASTAEAPPAPPFDTFWRTFLAAVRSGRRADVAALAIIGSGGISPREWGSPENLGSAFEGPPVRALLLALTPRDVGSEGAARVVTVRVAYDSEGRAVPEDEGVTDSAVRLRFEVVEGAWRLVRIDVAG